MNYEDLMNRFWQRKAKRTLEGEELEAWFKILHVEGGRLIVSPAVWDVIHMHPVCGPFVHLGRIIRSDVLVRGQCIAVSRRVNINYALGLALKHWSMVELDATEGVGFTSKYT